ncbi:MAG: hypothetical protein WD135_05175 [Ferruginibacter sp.]
MIPGKATQEFDMQLHILPTDTLGVYSWKIIYGDQQQDSRPYLLKAIDSSKGKWVIDENNGIVLSSNVMGNCLLGAFTVMGNTITDSYCLENNSIKVSFTSIRLGESSNTGLDTVESPAVINYRVGSYQTGILLKLPNSTQNKIYR